jgi:hypothetical protein
VKDEVPPVFYTPYRQDERAGYLVYYVKTTASTDSVMAAIPPLLAKIDSTLPVADLKTLQQQVRDNVFQDRWSARLPRSSRAGDAARGRRPLRRAWPTRWRSARVRSACAWRSARDATNIRSLVLRQVGWMTLIGGGTGLLFATVAGIFARSQLYNMERWTRWCCPARRRSWTGRADGGADTRHPRVTGRSHDSTEIRVMRSPGCYESIRGWPAARRS